MQPVYHCFEAIEAYKMKEQLQFEKFGVKSLERDFPFFLLLLQPSH